MAYTQDDLDCAERHVAHGERFVIFQRSLVDAEEHRDSHYRAAVAWLTFFEAGLARHVVERDKIAESIATRIC